MLNHLAAIGPRRGMLSHLAAIGPRRGMLNHLAAIGPRRTTPSQLAATARAADRSASSPESHYLSIARRIACDTSLPGSTPARSTWERSPHACSLNVPSGSLVRHRRVVVGYVAPIAGLAKLEGQPVGRTAADHEPLEVDGAMVEIANGREVGQVMATAAAPVLDVVQVEPDVPTASRNGAAVPIPREHLFTLARRDGRGRPLGHRGI